MKSNAAEKQYSAGARVSLLFTPSASCASSPNNSRKLRVHAQWRHLPSQETALSTPTLRTIALIVTHLDLEKLTRRSGVGSTEGSLRGLTSIHATLRSQRLRRQFSFRRQFSLQQHRPQILIVACPVQPAVNFITTMDLARRIIVP